MMLQLRGTGQGEVNYILINIINTLIINIIIFSFSCDAAVGGTGQGAVINISIRGPANIPPAILLDNVFLPQHCSLFMFGKLWATQGQNTGFSI